jgi:hypothetical protein
MGPFWKASHGDLLLIFERREAKEKEKRKLTAGISLLGTISRT